MNRTCRNPPLSLWHPTSPHPPYLPLIPPGRGVKFEAALVTYIPQSMALSPVEELLTQKVTELLIRVTLSNPRTNDKRDWLWSPEPFFDRVGHMRTAWQEWMLKSIEPSMHTHAKARRPNTRDTPLPPSQSRQALS